MNDDRSARKKSFTFTVDQWQLFNEYLDAINRDIEEFKQNINSKPTNKFYF